MVEILILLNLVIQKKELFLVDLFSNQKIKNQKQSLKEIVLNIQRIVKMDLDLMIVK
jgi:hypothetical protein